MPKLEREPLLVWDRARQTTFIEKVYGEGPMRLLYGSLLGRILTDFFLTRAWVSRLYGWLQSNSFSRRKIPKFVRRYEIDLSEFETREFSSFNDFFTRRFREGARPIAPAPNTLVAPAEARYLGFGAIRGDERVPVKGFYLSIPDLLERPELIKIFSGGPLLLARLCPVDYHRYHFPADAKILDRFRIPGKLHSVNPYALGHFPFALCRNERLVTLLDAGSLGRLALVSVGALMVGRMEERVPNSGAIRGAEYGKFLFGGSTVIIVGERGAWLPSADICKQTAIGRETLVRLGEVVGEKPAAASTTA